MEVVQPEQKADLKYWGLTKFKWDYEVDRMNRETFKNQKFRHIQKAIINAVLDGNDIFQCMPTGSGKSLIYQLTSQLSEGLTIVVQPLISLIYDQHQIMKFYQLRSLIFNQRTKTSDFFKTI